MSNLLKDREYLLNLLVLVILPFLFMGYLFIESIDHPPGQNVDQTQGKQKKGDEAANPGNEQKQNNFFFQVLNFIKEVIPNIFSVLFSFLVVSLFLYSRGIKPFVRTCKAKDKICKMEDEIDDMIDKCKSLEQNGIVSIYSNRSEYLKELRPEIIQLDKSECENNQLKEICIIGISLRDFFNDAMPNNNNKFYTSFASCVKNKKLKIEALILDNESCQAKIRQEMDVQNRMDRESSYKIDYNNTISFYNENKNDCFDLKLYSEVPGFCFLVKFKDYIVVDHYHAGGPGGKLPVFKYKKDSKAYDNFKSHFDYIWKHPTTKNYVKV